MTKNVITIDSSKTIKDAAKIMVDNSVSSVIVTQDKEPVGILRERDFLIKVAGDVKFSESVLNIIPNTLIYADPEQTVWDVVDLMKARNINSIPVINNKSEILGMVKFSDFLKAFSFD